MVWGEPHPPPILLSCVERGCQKTLRWMLRRTRTSMGEKRQKYSEEIKKNEEARRKQ